MKNIIKLLVLVVTLTSLTASEDSILFKWEANPQPEGVTNYVVYASRLPITDDNATESEIVANVGNFTEVSIDVTSGGLWHFAVKAQNKDGLGTISREKVSHLFPDEQLLPTPPFQARLELETEIEITLNSETYTAVGSLLLKVVKSEVPNQQ